MDDGSQFPSGRTLTAAAVLAGLVSVLLIAVGFWLRDWQPETGPERLSDLGWWLGVLAHVAGYLGLGKIGFKVAFVAVVGGWGLLMWARRSRPSANDPVPAGDAPPTHDAAPADRAPADRAPVGHAQPVAGSRLSLDGRASEAFEGRASGPSATGQDGVAGSVA